MSLDSSSENVYVNQLRDVFNECDPSGTGHINKPGLLHLCDTLQLSADHTQALVQLCESNQSKTVTFDDFKDGFIHILAANSGSGEDGLIAAEPGSGADITTNDADTDLKVDTVAVTGQVSPKYVRDGKKYGRRSKPESITGVTRSNDEMSTTYQDASRSDVDRNEDKKKLKLDLNDSINNDFDTFVKHQRLYKCKLKKSLERLSSMESLLSSERSERSVSAMSTPRFASHNVSRTASLSLSQSSRLKEQIEGMGEVLCKSDSGMSLLGGGTNRQWQLPVSQPQQQLPQCNEEERDYLQQVWAQLNIGSDGFISKSELADVCRYIDLHLPDSGLDTLFNKLDMDQDGYVGFDEFVEGFSVFSNEELTVEVNNLVDEASVTPAAISSQSQQQTEDSDTNTGQLLSLVSDNDENKSGIFSCLDSTNSGFAAAADVVEFWESQGIEEGYKMLQYILTGNVHSDASDISDINAVKIKPSQQIDLHELTCKLLQLLLSSSLPPPKNPFFIVAMGTFQAEISYLRSASRQMMNERDKLRNDISDANARALLLAEEVDERQMKIEKYNSKKLKSLEKRYEDQIRTLQVYVEQEREVSSKDVLKLKQQLQDDCEKFEENETMYKSKVSNMSQENNRLERECEELSDKVDRLEKQTARQQKDLQDMNALRNRISELESSESGLTGAQYSDIMQQLQNAYRENKELTDRNDELTSEIERLKQQLSAYKKKRRKNGADASQQKSIGGNGGAGNSNGKGNEDESTSNDDVKCSSSDGVSPIVQYRRRATRVQRLKEEEEALKVELIKQQHEKEMSDVAEKANMKYRDLEIQYESEIARLEEKYRVEKLGLAKRIADLEDKLQAVELERTCSGGETQQALMHVVDEYAGDVNTLVGDLDSPQSMDVSSKSHATCDESMDTISGGAAVVHSAQLMDSDTIQPLLPQPLTPHTHLPLLPSSSPNKHMHTLISALQHENDRLKSELTAALVSSGPGKPASDMFDSREERLSRVMHDLYVENANLMSSLQITEKRGLKKESENVLLRKKCEALEQLLVKETSSASS